MSIDAAMLNEMVKNNLKFPNASLDTMANLVKLNIPVTQENIEQYEAYTHYERNMAGQLDSLPSALSDTLTQLTGQDPVQAGTFKKCDCGAVLRTSAGNAGGPFGNNAAGCGAGRACTKNHGNL